MTDKAAVVGLRASGMSFRGIGEVLGVDQRTAARNFKRIMATNSYERKKGSGKTRKTTEREDQLIIREVRKDRMITSKTIKTNLTTLQVSRQTIRRRINECSEFRSQWQTKKPFISEANRVKRVAWCRHHPPRITHVHNYPILFCNYLF